jgi:hypothetical protein
MVRRLIAGDDQEHRTPDRKVGPEIKEDLRCPFA